MKQTNSNEAGTKYNTPLRQAQRELTRSRITNAARDLFFEHHYDTTTMDEIAVRAGLRRSTLYLHYKDKSEILQEVIADYMPKAEKILKTLPGPNADVSSLLKWVKQVTKFVARERAPLGIILEYRSRHDDETMGTMANNLLEAMGNNNPLFREAAKKRANPELRARSLMLLQQLTYACNFYLENKTESSHKAMLKVVAEDFHAFLSSHP